MLRDGNRGLGITHFCTILPAYSPARGHISQCVLVGSCLIDGRISPLRSGGGSRLSMEEHCMGITHLVWRFSPRDSIKHSRWVAVLVLVEDEDGESVTLSSRFT